MKVKAKVKAKKIVTTVTSTDEEGNENTTQNTNIQKKVCHYYCILPTNLLSRYILNDSLLFDCSSMSIRLRN